MEDYSKNMRKVTDEERPEEWYGQNGTWVPLNGESLHNLLNIIHEHAHNQNTYQAPDGWMILGAYREIFEKALEISDCKCGNCHPKREVGQPTFEDAFLNKEVKNE